MFALNLLLQLLFAIGAFAAPTLEASRMHLTPRDWGVGGGIIGFIILVLDIIVFLEVLKSNRPVSHKVLWCALVFFFPVGGMIIYYLFSNRHAHGNYEPIL